MEKGALKLNLVKTGDRYDIKAPLVKVQDKFTPTSVSNQIFHWVYLFLDL